ncbi:MAG: alpha/beta hydrolase [Pseudomonadota bacterium]
MTNALPARQRFSPLWLVALGVGLAVAFAANVASASEKYTWTQYSYEPYPFPVYVDDRDRYPAATPPAGTVNRHGEIEHIGEGVFATHWFVDANGPVWHFVTAGDPSKDVILFIHGYPDTWYAYSKVMAKLADDYYIVAVDTLGYGQSDKRPEVDVSYASVAKSLVTLLDKIGVSDFDLISHDRGSIISEHLITIGRMNRRIKAFMRMQQSFDQPHGLPRPPHAQMATAEWQSRDRLIRSMYSSNYVSVEIPEEEVARLEWEFGFEGTAEAAARTFVGTSFDIEREFRMKSVIPKMTMPVLFVQGYKDPGQKAEEYYRSAKMVPDGRVELIDTNHFMHTEDPELVAELAREFFSE